MRRKLRKTGTKKVPTYVDPNNQLPSKFSSLRAEKKAFPAMMARFTSPSNHSQCLEPINDLFSSFPSPSARNIYEISMYK